jgi:Predicted membrane protein (DUF2207) C-terminal domain/Predicted membrane protein (DUF2207) N-terminal domain
MIVALVAVAATALGAGAPARAQTGESIHSYRVRIDIRPDDSIRITEVIEYDFGSSQRHGIFRDVPTRETYDDRYDRVFPLHVESVSATGGASAQFDVSNEPGGITRIKIGDPDATTSGVHTYAIVYTVDAAMNGFADHDELYWNAIGDQWSVPVGHATATVNAPAGILDTVCYAGPVRATTSCDKQKVMGETARFTQSGLFPFEAFTVVVALPKGSVAEPHPRLVEPWSFGRAFSRTPISLGVSVGLLALLVAGCVWLFWTRGRDRRFVGSPVDQTLGNPTGDSQAVPLFERGVAPVEFAPPEDLRPGQVGTIVDEQANTLDVTATIIDLAVRGYLTIEEIPKEGWFGKPDWTLHRTDKADGDLLTYERTLLTGLFKDGNDPALSSLKRAFSERLAKVEDELYADAVKRGWFVKRPDKVRESWHARGALLFVAGLALTFVLARWTTFGLAGVPVVLAGLLLTVGARWMPSKTAKGTAIARRVGGFRTVIETAETHMSRWAEEQNVFTRYLPYAIVFGCTERWAKAFEGLQLMPPDTTWYRSTRPFIYADFGRTLDDFSVTTGGTIASTPASSGSSGFSGGGSSGGGGGGGGGGSW